MKQLPNLILITVDFFRSDHASCYGYHRVTTPNIDNFAKNSILFENFFSNSCWTFASISSILTGKLPSQHGAHWENFYLGETNVTLPRWLCNLGYTSIMTCSNPWLSRNFGIPRDFNHCLDLLDFPATREITKLDRYKLLTSLKKILKIDYHYNTETVRASRINQKVFNVLDNMRNKPFFLFCHYMDCHIPYIPPYRHRGLFSDNRHSCVKFGRKYREVTYQFMKGNLETLTSEIRNRAIDHFDECLFYIDHHIGRLLKKLDQIGLLEKSIVIISADHGVLFGEHNIMGNNLNLYNGVLKVPFIISYPKLLPQNVRIKRFGQSIDILPTVAELLGIEAPDGIQGQSLLSHLGTKGNVGNVAVAELFISQKRVDWYGQRYNRRLRAIQNPWFKFIKSSNGDHELFDISQDPAESNNILESHPDMMQDLDRQLTAMLNDDFFERTWGQLEEESIRDEKVKQHLQALGYF